MHPPDKHKWYFFRIVGWSLVILPTLLLFWVVGDLLFFSLAPWQFGEYGLGYIFLKESIFWKQYTDHCAFFNIRWIASVIWHFSWIFTSLGIKHKSKYEQKANERISNAPLSLENVETPPKDGKWSNFALQKYINRIHLILLTVGTYVVKFKKESFVSRGSGDIIWNNVLAFLIIAPPISILPQYFLSKIYFRRIFREKKIKWDIVSIPLLMVWLLISFLLFGRTICMA